MASQAAGHQNDGGQNIAPPQDLIALGVVTGAYGLQGWVRIAPFSADATTLLGTHHWWLQAAGLTQPLALTASKKHGAVLLAKWSGSENPEAADALKGAMIAVSRAEFPAPLAGEFYWQDLIGVRVLNRAGNELGTVRSAQQRCAGSPGNCRQRRPNSGADDRQLCRSNRLADRHDAR